MAKKDIKFTLDTIDSRYSPVGTVKQLDSVFFYIKITENGVTKDLTGQTIKLFAIKEDKKIVEQTTKINITNQREGLVEIELLNSAIQVHGFTYFELEISDSNGIISTADFILRVNKRVGSDEAIESTNEVSTLKEIEVYVAQAKQEIKEFKKLQDKMLATNENINNQEVLRVKAEEERVSAEVIRDKKIEEFSSQVTKNVIDIKEIDNVSLEIEKALDKGIFDIKNMYEWEAGYINSNGEYINLNYMKRVTKPKFIPYDTVDVTMNGENYNLHVIEYNAEGVFVKSTDYINKDRFTIDIAEDHKYAFCLQYRRNNEFIADLSTLTLTCNVGMNFKIVKNTKKLESVNIKEKIHFNIGIAASSNMGNAICKYTLNKDNSYTLNMISGNNETYSLYNFALEKAYIDINKKKYLIEIKNNSTEPIDFSNIKNRFTLSNRKDFSGTVFHLKDLMTDTVLQPNSSKKILLDMNSEVIKEVFKDTSDVLYFVFGYYSTLQTDRDFKLSFIDFTEYERKGVVVADYLSDFDLNDYNIFKLNTKNDLKTIKNSINTDYKIVCYGDSLTMGAGWEDHSPDGIQRGYPEFIQEFSGITTINTGIGGDKCNDIFARLGSEPVVINNITIPASKTPVELGYPLTTILGRQFKSDIYNKHDKPYKINPVIINGVIGTLTQPIFQGSYYFTRKEVGEEVIVNRPTLLTTGQMIKLRNPNDIHIFYVGQNGGYENIDDWIQQLRNAIDYIGCDKYLIIACQTNLHNSTWDNIYDRFKKEFRGKFVDIRKYMLEYGLEDCKISPTPQDLEDISKGVCPTSLKKQGDKVHFNYYGYKVIGKLLYNRLKELYPKYFNN